MDNNAEPAVTKLPPADTELPLIGVAISEARQEPTSGQGAEGGCCYTGFSLPTPGGAPAAHREWRSTITLSAGLAARVR
jgi:hypothetical protein